MSHSHPHSHAHFHDEEHFSSPEIVRDLVIGMADGLTVPFALAAGLSAASSSSSIIVAAGLAEIVAGSIAMGLGGYLAAKSDVAHYDSERAREVVEVREIPHVEEKEIYDVFKTYGLSSQTVAPVVKALTEHPEVWVDFMMRFELGLERPDPRRAIKGAVTIASAYVVGGLVPLSPYMFTSNLKLALSYSVVLTFAALFIFGMIKGRYIGGKPYRSAFQTVAIGGIAAIAAYLLARLVS